MKNATTGKYVEKTEWIRSLKANGVDYKTFKKIYMRLPNGRCKSCLSHLRDYSVIYITRKDSSNTWSGKWYCHERCAT